MFVFMFESCMQWGVIVVIDIIARQYRASSGDGKVDFCGVLFVLCSCSCSSHACSGGSLW